MSNLIIKNSTNLSGQYVTPSQVDSKIATQATTDAGKFVPKWQANTAYTSGQYVMNPSGQIVSVSSSFTSGSIYNETNFISINGQITPSDYSAYAWTIDPLLAVSPTNTTSGTLIGAKTHVAVAGTPTIATFTIQTAATTSTVAKIGLYDSSGTLIGYTADQSTAWVSSGTKSASLSMNRPLVIGETLYICLLWVGTGTLTIYANTSSPFLNINRSASATSMFRSFALLGQADLPPTMPFSSATTTGFIRMIMLI